MSKSEMVCSFGWSKFIVVVPSIAIREGVRKSFETMQDHFMEYYGKKPHKKGFIIHSRRFRLQDQVPVLLAHIHQFKLFHHGFDVFRIRLISLLSHLCTSDNIACHRSQSGIRRSSETAVFYPPITSPRCS